MPDFGYAGKILRINLSGGKIDTLETSRYSERFLGGRGIGAKIYWDETSPGTRALEPGNAVIFATGPLMGFTRFAGCRWQICGKSAATEPESFSYANLGGSWGAWLKFAGYDCLVVKGKAEQPVYIMIDDGYVSIRDASGLWGKTTHHTEALLHDEFGKTARVLSTGPAGENMVAFSTVLAADNASGSGGFGAVMGSKNLKAIVIRADNKIRPVPAAPRLLDELARQVYRLRTANYEDYEHKIPLKIKNKACFGCINGCTRGYYEAENGWEFKSQCQAAAVYSSFPARYYGESDEKRRQVSDLATRLCDEYGLDTIVVSPMLEWLDACYREGILTEENTGMPLSSIGSEQFIRDFAGKVSSRKGFGDVLAMGTIKAAGTVGDDAVRMLNGLIATRGSEKMDYDPRLFLAHGIFYATEPRRAIQLLHAITLPVSRWNNWRQGWKDARISTEVFRDIAAKHWGGAAAGDLTSFEDKSLAAKIIQDYSCAKESLVLCDLAWPIWQVTDIDDSIGNGTLESRIVSAVTGRNVDEAGLFELGERIFNLQRAIMVRQGWQGRNDDRLLEYIFSEPAGFVFIAPESEVPGPDGKISSMKGNRLRREDFEKMKDDYYTLRGWNVANGLQTAETLNKLRLDDVAAGLGKMGLLG